MMDGEMDGRYAVVDGRKVVYSSLKPADLLRNANVFTYVVLIVIAVLIAVAALTVSFIVVRRRKKKKALQN
jgi:t-SNARE complex subunit (syntaxin)